MNRLAVYSYLTWYTYGHSVSIFAGQNFPDKARNNWLQTANSLWICIKIGELGSLNKPGQLTDRRTRDQLSRIWRRAGNSLSQIMSEKNEMNERMKWSNCLIWPSNCWHSKSGGELTWQKRKKERKKKRKKEGKKEERKKGKKGKKGKK